MKNDMVFDPKIKEYIPRDEFQFYKEHEEILDSKSITTEGKKEYLEASLGFNVTSFDDDSFPSKSFQSRNPDGSLITEYKINSNNDFRHRNSGRNNQNAAKLVDKYNNLAREALSTGDKILSENYLQHADHFSRILIMQEVSKVENQNNNVIEQNFKKDIDTPNPDRENNLETK